MRLRKWTALDIIDKSFYYKKKREKDGPSSAFFKI